MGCGVSKEFEEAVVTSPASPFTAAQCSEGVAPASGTVTLVAKASGMQQSSTISEGGAIIAKGKVVSNMNKEGALEGADGTRLGVTKVKTVKLIPLHTETRVLRPAASYEGQTSEDFASDDKDKATKLYNFALVTAKHSMATAEGTYALYTAGEPTPMLTAKRLGGIKQRTMVYDTAGTLVAKTRVTDAFGKEITMEIAGGVDRLAVVTLVSQLAPGGGGANAGSGTGAYGS